MDDTLKELAFDHRTDMMATANDGFDISLEIVGADVIINGITKKVIFTKKENGNGDTKHISAKIGDIDIGDIVAYQNRNWLITSFPTNNDVYLKADVRQCNSTYPIKANKTSVLMEDENGKPILDKFGDPVYQVTEGAITNIPCIVESSIISSNENTQLPLPEGQLRVTMQYQNVDDIAVNKTFSIYQNTYKIRNIDYTKVINDKGIIALSVEQVSNKVVK